MTTISESDVRAFVLNYVSDRMAAKHLNPTDLDDEFDLLESGAIDSFGLIVMLGEMENRFSILVDFEQMDPELFTNLKCFCEYVSQQAIPRSE